MKQFALWLAVVSLFISTIGCDISSQANAQSTQTNQAVTPKANAPSTAITPARPKYETDEKATKAEYDRRVVFKREFMSAAKNLVVKGKSQKHADVYNFVNRHGMLALPTVGNCIMVEGPATDPFAIVVILPEDAKLGSPWSDLLTNLGAMASYGPDERTMYLSPELSGSPLGKGLTLLHEGYHAHAHLVKKEPQAQKGDAIMFCQGEVEAHSFVGELVGKVYAGYDPLVDQIAKQIGGVQTGNTITVRTDQALRAEIDEALPKVFGQLFTNDSERRALNIDVWYLANFRSIERKFPKDQWRAEKIRFLKDYLERSGSAQWLHG